MLYEVVLMLLGVFLFMLLSAALVYFVIKKQEIKTLLFFFAISILMIGYPSIQQLTISSNKFELSKYQQEFIENPNDSVAKQKMQELTLKHENRAETSNDILQISKTKLLLGNTDGAIVLANKAIEKEKKTIEKNREESPAISTDTLGQHKSLITAQAYQLKELAKLQNRVTIESDTAVLSAKLENIEVNENLKGTKTIVRRNAFEKTVSRGN